MNLNWLKFPVKYSQRTESIVDGNNVKIVNVLNNPGIHIDALGEFVAKAINNQHQQELEFDKIIKIINQNIKK